MDAAAVLGTLSRIAWRKKWILALPILVCTAASLAVLDRLPRFYRATTVILVQPPNIPSEYVKPTVPNIESGMKTLRQQVTSRTSLERMGRELHLLPPDGDPRSLERRIEDMRRNIELQVQEDRSFTLSYLSTDPEVAASVANRLADQFIENSARRRQGQARDTSQFLNEELQRLRGELNAQEKAIADFKRRHQAELPSQQDANLRALESLQRDLRENQLSVERARDRKAILEVQMSTLPRTLVGADGTSLDDPGQELSRLRAELEDLRTRYTDRYPEVQRLKRRIQKLEAAIAELPEGEEETAPASPADPAHELMKAEIRREEMSIDHLETEATRIREEIARYRDRVEVAPKREQELLGLTRDYDTLKKNYQSLLRKRTDAEIAETLEAERQGEQFIVLDRAQVPAIPFRPNPVQVISMGVLLGLFLGCGMVAGLEVLRPTFYVPQQVEEQLGVPVIAAVPVIRLKGRRGGKIAGAGMIAAGTLLGAVWTLLGPGG